MTAPIYDTHGVTLYRGDCRDILPTLARAAAADLMVTDPPYGMDYQSNHRAVPLAKMAGDNGGLDVAACLALAATRLHRGRHVYVFGRFDLANTNLAVSAELIWDKGITGMGDVSSPWGGAHEVLTFAVYEPSPKNRAGGKGALSARLRKGSVIRCRRPISGAVRHPSEKPVALLRQLIESSSVLGEVVLDPFAGVGSTLVAALIEGRRAIGIEIDSGYCDIAIERIEKAAACLAALDECEPLAARRAVA